MIPVCSAAQARKRDACAIENYHCPSLILMEHAAQVCARALLKKYKKDTHFLIVAGPGNNGGDGLAIARILFQFGAHIHVLVAANGHYSADEKVQLEMLQALLPAKQIFFEHLPEGFQADCIVDALFGNGLSRDVSGYYAELIEQINASNAQVVSIDVPSGLDGTTGKILGTAVQADSVLVLDCWKTGLFINDGSQYLSTTTYIDLQFPHAIEHEVQNTALLLDEKKIAASLPKRSSHSHKGTFGKALMIGGSTNMHGAIFMAASACYHAGIGTLTLALCDSLIEAARQKMNFCMLLPLESKDGWITPKNTEILDPALKNASILSIGNAMGKQPGTRALVLSLLKSGKPLILDADAIAYAKEDPDFSNRKAITYLTPHIKEMADLCGCSVHEVLEDPFGKVKEFCVSHPNCVLILKSDFSLVGYQDQLYVYSHPNSALAKGGSGDILCGILCAMAASCKTPVEAAIAAVALHNQAASLSSVHPASFMPEQIIENLGKAFSYFEQI
jgi:NAD(P)H-hydrate epimerase